MIVIADDRDDIGTTVSAFMPLSLDPPLVALSLIAGYCWPRPPACIATWANASASRA